MTAIAREKAAIIERGDLAITGADGDGLAVIRRRARRLDVPLTEVPPAPLIGWDRDGIEVELGRLGRTRVSLRGRHQAANVALADALLDSLDAAGIVSTPLPARRVGYATAAWPGRLELVSANGRDVLLDGAHNPAGAAALAVALGGRPQAVPGRRTGHAGHGVDGRQGRRWRDRRLRGRSTALAGATVVCTSLALPRALDAAELAARWRRQRPTATVLVEPDPLAALDRALTGAWVGIGPVVVAGSLYLVGAARGRLVDDPDLRDPSPSEDA